jgi:UDP-N-acetylglucosamine pyrophosphorylase
MDAIKNNEIAVVTFAGGMGSRWSEGAPIVKAINPFIKIDGRFRTFIEIHLAKSRRTQMLYGQSITHIFTTSYLTHHAIEDYLRRVNQHGYNRIFLSPAKSIGHRVYPTERDIRSIWQRYPEKREYMKRLIEWAVSHGEAEDYQEGKPIMRFNPPGHWYEIPNMIKNGVLARMIKENPNLKYLLCHNIDTLGADIEPSILGMHIVTESCLTFEITPRRIEDHGGGLARIDGHIRLVEGLALPNKEDEFKLSYYNSNTNWITIDLLLEFFGLDRGLIIAAEKEPKLHHRIAESLKDIEKKIPTYVTIKNVRHIKDTGQEEIHPVAQFEKLWVDMTSFKDLKINYITVPRYRGQQLKDPSHLDIWLRDGSFEYVKSKTCF